jgi:hypothetical protein
LRFQWEAVWFRLQPWPAPLDRGATSAQRALGRHLATGKCAEEVPCLPGKQRDVALNGRDGDLVPRGKSATSTLRQTLLASCVAGSMTVIAFPAVAGGADEPRCCGCFPNWFFGAYYPVPVYYAGPLSGATYEYYYSNYWGRSHLRHRRAVLVK